MKSLIQTLHQLYNKIYTNYFLSGIHFLFLTFGITVVISNFLGPLMMMPLASILHLVGKFFISHAAEKIILKLRPSE